MNTHNPNCDGDQCTKTVGEVRRLPAGGGSNMLLCKECYLHEIEFQQDRNYDLDDNAKFDLPQWDHLEVAHAPSIYEEVIAAGVQTASHESDLYAEATPEILDILKRHKNKNYTFFANQVEGGRWVDIPFAYLPFWESKQNKEQSQ